MKYTGNLILAPGHKEDPYIREFSHSACWKTNCIMCCFGLGRQEWTPECRWIHSGDRHCTGPHLPPWLRTSLWFLDVCSTWWSGWGNQAAITNKVSRIHSNPGSRFCNVIKAWFRISELDQWSASNQAFLILSLSLSHMHTHTHTFSLSLLSLSLSLYWITWQKVLILIFHFLPAVLPTHLPLSGKINTHHFQSPSLPWHKESHVSTGRAYTAEISPLGPHLSLSFKEENFISPMRSSPQGFGHSQTNMF